MANAAGAATVALGSAMPLDEVVERLATAPQVPGRMERLADTPFTVLRDYAHTPGRVRARARDAATAGGRAALHPVRVRRRARHAASGRSWGGSPPSAPTASSSRPTIRATRIPSEDHRRHRGRACRPARTTGSSTAKRPSRTCCRWRAPGDTVLLAGKGHETYQVEGSTYRHFDEREIVRSLLAMTAPRFTDAWVRAALRPRRRGRRRHSTPSSPTPGRWRPDALFVALAGERFDAHEFPRRGARRRRGRRGGAHGHRRRSPGWCSTRSPTRCARSATSPRRTAGAFRRPGDRHHRPERQDVHQGDGGGGARDPVADPQDARQPQQPGRRADDDPRGAGRRRKRW